MERRKEQIRNIEDSRYDRVVIPQTPFINRELTTWTPGDTQTGILTPGDTQTGILTPGDTQTGGWYN